MKTILLIIKLSYYFILLCIFTFLSLFPTDENWNLTFSIFFWMVGIYYLIRIITRNITIDNLMKQGLFFFIVGSIISILGIFVAGEILMKLSFLSFMLGMIESFIDYKRV